MNWRRNRYPRQSAAADAGHSAPQLTVAETAPVEISIRGCSPENSTAAIIYDALGCRVEQPNGSGTTEILYGADGSKLALMNGQSVSKARSTRGAGIDISYALQQQLGLTGNAMVSWRFTSCAP